MGRRHGAIRQQGDRGLGETVTIPAGTVVGRGSWHGRQGRLIIRRDTVLPADRVADGKCIIGGEEWEYDPDWGWDAEL